MTAARPIILGPGEGRRYDTGAISAVFKADGAEVGDRFSVSEWWLDPMREGPGAHEHEDSDEIFYVIEGTASILVGETWHRLEAGGLCVVPRGTVHDFRNEAPRRMGLLNVFLPGAFEPMMPAIADWFREHPPKEVTLRQGEAE